MIKNYYNFLRLLLLFVALSQVDTLFAQSLKVSGKISDSSSPDGIPGVLVSVKGKQQNTVSDMNGNYALTVADANAVLQFKSVGYQTQEVAVNGQTTINVTLTADLKSLDEVVVMGYGTQKKVNLIGAVSTIKVDEALTTRSVSNVSSALSGLVPGLAVIQSSGMAGNNDASLVIRGVGTVNGNSGPLIVVDGMPGVDINRVNINDVETITVLKDASSAAVYGSRASNGVILITTKSGKGSKKASIDFNGNTSIETPTKGFSFLADYPRSLTVLQRNQLNGALEDNLLYKNGTIDEWMAKGMIDPLRYPNTDWWDIIIRDGVISNYNVSATGGTEKSNFFASVGVKDEKGLQINNDYNQ
ncbi:MAG TPA: carboxypeptidase-like regulatory domain-containing protein, partial [Arachidicoccus soli]|nr:carboxypeptidase-like regulatory domain-containing protein [Arachidicoccus soli]